MPPDDPDPRRVEDNRIRFLQWLASAYGGTLWAVDFDLADQAPPTHSGPSPYWWIQRERALTDLKRGRVQILVATDLASRGIEVDGIAHVVNYDVPHTAEDYVHRIGSGNRSASVGDAFTLMSPDEQAHVAAIERFMGRTVPRVMLPDFDYRMRPNEISQVVSYPERGEDKAAAASPKGHGPARAAAPKGHARPTLEKKKTVLKVKKRVR